MVQNSLISAIVRACIDTPREVVVQACAILGAANEEAAVAVFPRLTGIMSKESLIQLKKGVAATGATARELALALSATIEGIQAGRANPDIHLVWTGPDTPRTSPRDTLPQMLEMIGNSKHTLLLVTFAAFKVTRIMEALNDAHQRGVQLMVVVESVSNSGGQISHDACKAFPPSLQNAGCLWLWPLAKRKLNKKGLPGKLHAKCLVIDGRETLVSSANLTEDAMERNIEMGLRCTNSAIAQEIELRFNSLKKAGILLKVKFDQ
ncbi:MAG: hypothetical protein EOP84_33955 [Verrucomicrobiaceae bacterium]|nr:MAG: hypothetical protein EOP84_33955 [Verrucomicrobiaceae bacterium]